jgi:plasmid stabilization system protein ParE
MTLRIRWTRKAYNDFARIVEYHSLELGEKSGSEFCSKVFDATELLSQFPMSGSKYNEEKSIRSLRISQYTRLLYRVKTDSVIILKLIDTRRRPGKINF